MSKKSATELLGDALEAGKVSETEAISLDIACDSEIDSWLKGQDRHLAVASRRAWARFKEVTGVNWAENFRI